MLIFLSTCVVLAICCGVIAAVYREILAYEPIASWWWAWGNKFEKRWFFAPVWGCVKCIAGQFGLWSFFFLVIIPAINGNFTVFLERKAPVLEFFALFFGIVLTICGAILTAIGTARLISNLSKK